MSSDCSQRALGASQTPVGQMFNSTDATGTGASLLSRQLELVGKLAASTVLIDEGLQPALREITEIAGEVLDVDRVAIWRIGRDETEITCGDAFQRSDGSHVHGQTTKISEHREHIEFLRQQHMVAVADLNEVNALPQSGSDLLKSLGDTALLEATVWREGRFIGTMAFAMLGTPRIWSEEEQALAGVFVEFVSRIFATHERRELEAVLRDYAESASDWFWEMDADGRFTYISDRIFGATGDRPTSIYGNTFEQMGHEVSSEDQRSLDSALANRQPFQNLVSWRQLRDGRVIWTRSGGVPIFDDEGQFAGYRGSSADITDTKMLELEKTEQAELLEAILDNMPTIVSFCDRELQLVFVNNAHAKYHGLEKSEIVGKTLLEVLGPSTGAKSEDFIHEVIRTGEPIIGRIHTPDRYPDRIIRSSFVPQFDANRQVTGVVALDEDITESRHAKNRLRQSQKMDAIGQLTGGLAHDFNNILAIIRGNLDLMGLQVHGDHPLMTSLMPAINATQRGAAIIRWLLAFARHHPIDAETIDICDLVSKMHDLLRTSVGKNFQSILGRERRIILHN